jgi:predicted Zn finger-like uncharacterized protein
MHTRCPSCEAAFQLKASDLVAAAGVVRCGHCGKTFNAISHLFEDAPEGNQPPLKGSGVPPLLEGASIAQPELPGVSMATPERIEAGPKLDFSWPEPAESRQLSQRAWMIGCLVLAVILVTQLVGQWRSGDSALAGWLNPQSSAQRQLAPADNIQIIARDMHRHPSLDDAIVISATLRNPGDKTLRWPVLEVRLYDASQQILGVRRLAPEAYLVSETVAERGMTPELIVPVILEFVVGSSEPSGFELRLF